MKPFKTAAGARKRAAFEQAHQTHLTRRYQYSVEKRDDGLFYVVRAILWEHKK